MAAKTGLGVGVGVTLTVSIVLFVASAVLAAVFYSQKSDAQRQRAQLADEVKDFVADAERNRDEIRTLVEEARKKNQSAVAFLGESLKTVGEKTLGTKGRTPSQLIEELTKLAGTSPSVSAALTEARGQVKLLEERAAQADAARQAALTDLQNQVSLVEKQKQDYDAGVASLKGEIGTYKDQADGYREDLNKARGEMAAAIDRAKREAEDREAELNNRIAKLQEELQIVRGQLARLQQDRGKDIIRPTDEFALVDAEVIGLDPVTGNVFLNRGRKDKLVLGMSFEVFGEAAAIRPDDRTGEYNRGKASVEIVSIDEDSATARVTRTVRGNPVVRGDVLANAVYDPNKTYTFLVVGNFDVNGDQRFTREEQTDIKAQIREWGGRTVDSLQGDVDFVILGQSPILPPAPPTDAPVPVVQAYLRERAVVQEYERIQQAAVASSIPILNQNRLATLTGRR